MNAIQSEQRNVLSQTDTVDLTQPVSIDARRMFLTAKDAKEKEALENRVLYTNSERFRNRFIQTMAATDWGGFLGPPSQRAVSARAGGMTDIGGVLKSVDKAGYAKMMLAGAEHGTLEGESPMDEFSTGWPVLELYYKATRGAEDVVDTYYEWLGLEALVLRL